MNRILFTVLIAIFTVLSAGMIIAAGGAKGYRTLVLSERNTLSLNVPIDYDSAALLQSQLIEKGNKLSASEPLYLVLNSPGGSIDAGNTLIETVKGINQPVHTVTLFAASMAFMLAQSLDNRYIVETGTMMSHHAYAGGISGIVPGQILSRVRDLLDEVGQLEKMASTRMGLNNDQYQLLIRDEYWAKGPKAIATKSADEIIHVRCDKSLEGLDEPKNVVIFGFTLKVQFYKCPLITTPASMILANQAPIQIRQDMYNLFYNKAQFVRDYKRSMTQ